MLLTVRAVADETASLDNSQAITESPQSKPLGFHVNPPVHADKWHSAQDEPNSSLKAKEPLETKQGREFGLLLPFCLEHKEVILTCQ